MINNDEEFECDLLQCPKCKRVMSSQRWASMLGSTCKCGELTDSYEVVEDEDEDED
jgi:hypothetical protein